MGTDSPFGTNGNRTPMETDCIQGAWMPLELPLQGGRSRKMMVKNDGAVTSSDGSLTRCWLSPADCFQDKRNADRITFPTEVLLRQRIFGLVQGYDDLGA